MKKLIFVINDRAEVGKTTLSAALRGYLRDHEGFNTHLTAVVVGDDYERNPPPPVHDSIWNLTGSRKAKLKRLYDLTERYDVVICDVETDSSAALVDLYQRNDLDLELSDLDIDLTVVMPEVEEADCHEEICNLVGSFSTHADYVVARIPVDEFNSHLEPWDECDACEEATYMGAIVVEIPRITDAIQDRLEEHDVNFVEGVANTVEMPDELAEMLDDWRGNFRLEMEAAADYLHPARSRRGLPMAVSA